MPKTSTARELLVVALQDLNDAERAAVERLPSFEREVSPGLATFLSQARETAAEQAARLERALDLLDASAIDTPNIWLRGILDDAARDYDTIIPGPLRDVALVGAFRKGKQAARVSYETAVGLASVPGNRDLETGLLHCRDEAAAGDAALAQLLQVLLAGMSE